MKLMYLASGLTAAALLLTACGNNDSDSKDSKVNDSTTKKDDKLSQSQQEHSSKDSSSKSNSKSTSSDSHKSTSKSSMTADNLDQQHKLALALFDRNVGKYIVTAKELQAGEFTGTFNGANPHQTKPVSELKLNKLPAQDVQNLPEGVTAYSVQPSKGSFATTVAIGHDEVTIFGAQSGFSYQEMQRQGQVYKVSDLIKQFGDEADLESVANKISISDKPLYSESKSSSDSDDDKSDTSSNSSNDDDDSSSDSTVTRANVIDKVEDYEGHKLDTDEYTFKEPEQMSDGKWGFSYTDKNGDLAGSYIIDKDGNVTKYDEHGDEI